MKYIVTQAQIDSLRETIINYLDRTLTPYGGWNSPKQYEKEVDDTNEIFFYIEEDELASRFESPHMWYSICNNYNLNGLLSDDECPIVTIPPSKYKSLEGFFGEIWKPIFLEWFRKHTGLKINHVDVQD